MELVRVLHLLAMAFFVGGQLMLAAVVVPVLRGGDGTALRAAARRFGNATLVAVAVLLVTGSVMASEYDRWNDGTLQVKLALVVLVGGLVVAHMRRPQLHALEGLVFVGSLAIVWLGVALAH
jgi:putative copper export protein